MARLGGRTALWIFWFISTVISVLFMIVGLITFVNLTNVQWNEEAGDLGAQLNGALAACFMAPVLVAILDLSAMLILAKKTYALSGTGLSYGFLTASYLWAAIFLLLTGTTLTSVKHWTAAFEQSLLWTDSNTREFTAATVLAFLSVGGYLAMFGVLLGCHRSVKAGQMTMDEVEDRIRTLPMSDVSHQASPGPQAWSNGV
ncbi:hypothetical protein ACKKBG_A07525 [Auxenochlorella protothecoides x Auxenochlorella symbiontica]